MKHKEGPPKEPPAPPDTGPFRKIDYTPDPNDEVAAIKEMQAEIVDERALGVEVPKNIREGETLPNFAETCEAAYPKDIILWSLATGLLRYSGTENEAWSPTTSYTYRNVNFPDVKIVVKLPKEEASVTSLFKTKTTPAIVVEISTLNDFENKKRQSIEKKEEHLITSVNKLSADIQSLEKIVKVGIGDKPTETYRTELNDLKTALERLLFITNEELEKNKK